MAAQSLSLSLWVRTNLPWSERREGGFKTRSKNSVRKKPAVCLSVVWVHDVGGWHMWNRGHVFIWNSEGKSSPTHELQHTCKSEIFKYIACAGGCVHLAREQSTSTHLNSRGVWSAEKSAAVFCHYIRWLSSMEAENVLNLTCLNSQNAERNSIGINGLFHRDSISLIVCVTVPSEIRLHVFLWVCITAAFQLHSFFKSIVSTVRWRQIHRWYIIEEL